MNTHQKFSEDCTHFILLLWSTKKYNHVVYFQNNFNKNVNCTAAEACLRWLRNYCEGGMTSFSQSTKKAREKEGLGGKQKPQFFPKKHRTESERNIIRMHSENKLESKVPGGRTFLANMMGPAHKQKCFLLCELPHCQY